VSELRDIIGESFAPRPELAEAIDDVQTCVTRRHPRGHGGALQREATALFDRMPLRPSGSPHPEAPDAAEESAAPADRPVRKKGLSARQVPALGAIENFDDPRRNESRARWPARANFAAPGRRSSFSPSARDRRESTQLQSQRWFAPAVELPSVCALRGSRGRAAATLRIDALLTIGRKTASTSSATRRPNRFSGDPADSVPHCRARLASTVFRSPKASNASARRSALKRRADGTGAAAGPPRPADLEVVQIGPFHGGRREARRHLDVGGDP
jgi:hypothetical protein